MGSITPLNILTLGVQIKFSYFGEKIILRVIVRLGPVFDRGRWSSKWPGPGFPYYSSKAGATEVQKRNTGRIGSRYTSNESPCRVEYKSTMFFEVNTYLKYFSVDKPLCTFFSLCLNNFWCDIGAP